MARQPIRSLGRAALVGVGLGVAYSVVAGKTSEPGATPALAAPRPSWLKLFLAYVIGLVLTCVVLGVFAVCAIYWGLYNVAALSPHYGVSHRVIHYTATRSIIVRSSGLKSPPLDADDLNQGVLAFDSECVRCHGAPGQAPDDFARGMNPDPPPLPQVGREWKLEMIYWAISHGVKMTGMPAFTYRMPEKEIWAIAAFVKQLPDLSVADYRARVEQAKSGAPPKEATPGELAKSLQDKSRAERGRVALAQYACVSCHEIPGASASIDSNVGPSLVGIGSRTVIAGIMRNSDANLAAFIEHPKNFRPHGAMPDLGVDARAAADIVAYLRELR